MRVHSVWWRHVTAGCLVIIRGTSVLIRRILRVSAAMLSCRGRVAIVNDTTSSGGDCSRWISGLLLLMVRWRGSICGSWLLPIDCICILDQWRLYPVLLL